MSDDAGGVGGCEGAGGVGGCEGAGGVGGNGGVDGGNSASDSGMGACGSGPSESDANDFGEAMGGFGGLGIGNPGSYGGEQSVGAPGFDGSHSDTNTSGKDGSAAGMDTQSCHSSLSDVYGASNQTKTEQEDEEKAKAVEDEKAKHACGNCHGTWANPDKVAKTVKDAAIDGVWAAGLAMATTKNPKGAALTGLGLAGTAIAKDVLKNPENYAVEKGLIQQEQEQLAKEYQERMEQEKADRARAALNQLQQSH